MANLKTDAIVKGFLEYLKKENATDQLPEIARKLMSTAQEINEMATVFSTSPLSKVQSSQIVKILSANFGIKKVAFETDPSILGGIKVKVGDKILDLSLKHKLNYVAKSI